MEFKERQERSLALLSLETEVGQALSICGCGNLGKMKEDYVQLGGGGSCLDLADPDDTTILLSNPRRNIPCPSYTQRGDAVSTGSSTVNDHCHVLHSHAQSN